MTSFRITLSPSRRAAARFIAHVRREIQRAITQEKRDAGLTQSDIARALDVHRSVISREIRGYKDITLGRVAEIAQVLGWTPTFSLEPPSATDNGSNSLAVCALSEHGTVPIEMEAAGIPKSALEASNARSSREHTGASVLEHRAADVPHSYQKARHRAFGDGHGINRLQQ